MGCFPRSFQNLDQKTVYIESGLILVMGHIVQIFSNFRMEPKSQSEFPLLMQISVPSQYTVFWDFLWKLCDVPMKFASKLSHIRGVPVHNLCQVISGREQKKTFLTSLPWHLRHDLDFLGFPRRHQVKSL